MEGVHLILFWLALVAYGAEAGFRLAGVAPANIHYLLPSRRTDA